MEKIKIANSFGVHILGVNIPKNSVYGCIGDLTYYITALEDFEKPCPYITAMVCKNKSQFRLSSISKTSKMGRFISEWALNNIPYGTRVEYPYKRIFNKIVREKRPQTRFDSKGVSQSRIDGKGYKPSKDTRKDGSINEYAGAMKESYCTIYPSFKEDNYWSIKGLV